MKVSQKCWIQLFRNIPLFSRKFNPSQFSNIFSKVFLFSIFYFLGNHRSNEKISFDNFYLELQCLESFSICTIGLDTPYSIHETHENIWALPEKAFVGVLCALDKRFWHFINTVISLLLHWSNLKRVWKCIYRIYKIFIAMIYVAKNYYTAWMNVTIINIRYNPIENPELLTKWM